MKGGGQIAGKARSVGLGDLSLDSEPGQSYGRSRGDAMLAELASGQRGEQRRGTGDRRRRRIRR
ncbi:hypothetical protein [Fodinicola feengrottensis]|uniref:hypothetical protein n=1 Tax=Fodinicola feengrottensis TaxID=435914 RepID=UPI00244334BE|nr:hypothetical protein [Fodinicola feengrottensis]